MNVLGRAQLGVMQDLRTSGAKVKALILSKCSWAWVLLVAGFFGLIPSSVALVDYEDDDLKQNTVNKNFMKASVGISVIVIVVGIVILFVSYAEQGKQLGTAR